MYSTATKPCCLNLVGFITHDALQLMTHTWQLQSALNDLKDLLSRNGYPRGVITYNMNDVVNRNRNKPQDPITTVPKRDVFVVLPYLGLQSKFLTKQLKSCIYKFYGCINLKIIFRNTHRINSSFPYKGRLNRSLKSKVVQG